MSEYDSIIQSNRGSSYGSCVRTATKSTVSYYKHHLQPSDTLQGLSLKYGTTTEELRRVNKLYSSDTIFLKEVLLIPESNIPSTSSQCLTENKPNSEVTKSSLVEKVKTKETASVKIDENGKKSEKSAPVIEVSQEQDAFSFLKQLDSKILAGKKATENYRAPDVYSEEVNSTRIFEDNPLNHKTVFSHKGNAGGLLNL